MKAIVIVLIVGLIALATILPASAAGQNGNPMAHTISSRRIREITINGAPASEMTLFSYAAAYLGIPTVFVSGDAGICDKASLAANTTDVSSRWKMPERKPSSSNGSLQLTRRGGLLKSASRVKLCSSSPV